MAAQTLKIVPRLSNARGHADHGWLKTFHTFTFGGYNDGHTQFGSLRVINEDRVIPGQGFGAHPHAEFEIFSYVVEGELEHRDSMGNVEILKRGDLQMTSAGTGIRHSEHQHGGAPVHFLQIWAFPTTPRLKPTYYTRNFTDAEKTDKWARIVAPIGASGVSEAREAKGPAPVHSNLQMAATILSPGTTLKHTVPSLAGERKAYAHVIQRSGYNPGKSSGGSVKIGGGAEPQTLSEGDGAYMFASSGAEITFENTGDIPAEVLVFDVDL